SSCKTTASASASRNTSRTSAAVRAPSAWSAAARARAALTCRTVHFTRGSAAGATDNVSYPSPINRNADSGSEAISPHTLAAFPAARAASATILRSRSRSEEHTSELQSLAYLVCRLLLEKKNPTHHTP